MLFYSLIIVLLMNERNLGNIKFFKIMLIQDYHIFKVNSKKNSLRIHLLEIIDIFIWLIFLLKFYVNAYIG